MKWSNMSWLGRLAALWSAIALVLAFTTPPAVDQGQSVRLFYLHVPSIALAYLAFTATLIASACYLITKKIKWDHIAAACAEVGAVFTGLTLLVGMLWAKPTWGVYWTWSPRLTLTAIMFFVYLGYLSLRRAISDPVARAGRSAVLGMLSIVQVPIVHFSVTWWTDIHQPATIVTPLGIQMDLPIQLAFYASFVAFVLLGVVLIRNRIELARLQYDLDTSFACEAVAGDAIDTPMIGRAKS